MRWGSRGTRPRRQSPRELAVAIPICCRTAEVRFALDEQVSTDHAMGNAKVGTYPQHDLRLVYLARRNDTGPPLLRPRRYFFIFARVLWFRQRGRERLCDGAHGSRFSRM